MPPTPDSQVSLLSMCGILHYDDLQPQDEDYWNLLEVRWERVLNDLNDQNYILRHLQRLDGPFVRELLDWAEVETASSDITHAAEIIVSQADQAWVQILFLLIQFCENRRYDSFRTAAQQLLAEDQFQLVDGRFSGMPSNRLLLALRVFCDNPDNLRFLILWDRVDNRSYQRYSLVPIIPSQTNGDDEDDIELTTAEAERKIRDGVDLRILMADTVNYILREFEHDKVSNRQSVCQGVLLADGGESCWVFIKRQYKENYITEVRRTVFADEAEQIILRFRSRMREIDIRYELKETIELAARIPAYFLEAPVEYIPVNQATSTTHIQGLIDVLMVDGDSTLKLIEVDNTDLPLPGAPRMILRGDKATGITEALMFLETNHMLPLLGNLENLNSIKLSYTSPISHGRRNNLSYIVTIYLRQLHTGNQYFLSYSTRAPVSGRMAFEERIQNRYGIQIVPRTDA